MLYYSPLFLVVGKIAGVLHLAGWGRGRSPDFLDPVLDRDRVGRGPCDHRALRSDA